MMDRLAFFAHPLATVAPRDLLLLEAMQTRSTDVALEVGTGSGSSLLRLAEAVATLHGVDVAEAPIQRLRRHLARTRGAARRVELFALDFCDLATPRQLPTRYDLIYSCDTIEHVPQPATFFANLHATLKPGGRLFVTFPNEHPSHAHGITYFEHLSDIMKLLQSAGFDRKSIQIDTIEMRSGPGRVMRAGWSWPRRGALKLLRPRGVQHRNAPPQTFDETDFFAAADRLEPVAPLVNAYCWGIMRLMALFHPVFRIREAPEMIYDTNILIRALRGPDSHRSGG